MLGEFSTGNIERADSGDSRRQELQVPIERLKANPNQPRRNFDQADLESLAASIRERGIIQPLVVRRAAGDVYEIVAGERRWRAAQIARLHKVPVVVRELNDSETLEIAIIENIQRADLSPVEEAAAYRQLMDRFGHTQEKLSEILGKSRSHIANSLRLLNLPQDVRDMLGDGRLSAGHGRALITADNPTELAARTVERGLSVRATEALAQRHRKATGATEREVRPSATKDPDTKALEGELSAALGMKVAIQHRENVESGSLTVNYRTLDQLDTLINVLSAPRPEVQA